MFQKVFEKKGFLEFFFLKKKVFLKRIFEWFFECFLSVFDMFFC